MDDNIDNNDEPIIGIQKPDIVAPPTQGERKLTKLDILKKISPGTAFRAGLDDIVRGDMGAIIVVSNPKTSGVFQEGFKINCKFTSRRLAELAKMDGAIILSEDFKKILYVNTLLVPDRTLNTTETGTRHQAAERTAKQTGALVIAVSERRNIITVYYGNSKYGLQNTEDLLRRATETLQILEKQRDVFDELLVNLNVLEVTSLVSIGDVCTVLQRLEMILKMAHIINEYIVELGREGIIVRMRMREVTKGIEKTRNVLVMDYLSKPEKVEQFFDNLSFEGLLDSENIARLLFGESGDKRVSPKGYRILSKTNLNDSEINLLINRLKNLDGIIDVQEAELKLILKNVAGSFKEELGNLREQIMIGKKI